MPGGHSVTLKQRYVHRGARFVRYFRACVMIKLGGLLLLILGSQPAERGSLT